jgi:hypothetical protein
MQGAAVLVAETVFCSLKYLASRIGYFHAWFFTQMKKLFFFSKIL